MIDSSSRSAFEANTGVIEGFFGRPWSFHDRAMMLEFIAEVGWSSYIYAPKEDPYHRVRWFDPYPIAVIRRFQRLVDLAMRLRLRFNFALSPGLSICFSDRGQLRLLLAKFDQMIQLGVQSFSILFDDINPALSDADTRIYASPAHAQVTVTTALWEHIKDRCPQPSLHFCPTQYRGTTTSPYLEYLGAHLPPDIAIFWTGPRVVSPTITADDARRFGRILGRKPLLWDNYPVNDYDPARIFLGPLAGRDPDLTKHLTGVFYNPMNQAAASKVALTSCAVYLRSPQIYQPDQVWPTVKRIYSADAAADAIFENFKPSILNPRRPADGRLLKQHRSGQGSGTRSRLRALARKIARLKLDSLVPELQPDIKPFLSNLKAASRLLSSALRGRPDRRLLTRLSISRRKEGKYYLENEICDLARAVARSTGRPVRRDHFH